jgi:hypothetical protein
MSVATDLTEVTYTGNGTKTSDVTPVAYPITFPVLYDDYGNAEDIHVYVYIKATGALAADETLTATVSGLNVTTLLAWSSLYWISLVRIPEFLQEQAFNYLASIPSAVLENALDRQVMMLQYLKAKMAQLPLADACKNTFAAYDSTGQLTFTDTGITGTPAIAGGPIAEMLDDVDNLAGQKTLGLIPAGSIAAISAPIQTILDDATIAAVRTTMDVHSKAESKTEVEATLKMSDLEGCAASNAAAPDTDITITKGRRRDSTNAVNILLAVATTKELDMKFEAGTTNGGADLGMTVDKVTVVDATNLCTVVTKAAHGLTDVSTVIIPNLAVGDAAVSAHLAAVNVITVVNPTTFTIVLDGHTLAETSATEGVVIACSHGAIATAPGETYYMYLGMTAALVVDAFFSISAIGATPPTGYTLFRMIAAFRVGSTGLILPGTWSEGNQRFRYNTPVLDLNVGAVSSAARTLSPLSVPPSSIAYFTFRLNAAGAGVTCAILTDGVGPDIAAAGLTNDDIGCGVGVFAGWGNYDRLTDSSSRIGVRADATNGRGYIQTKGYWLPLGAYDYP